MLKSDLIDKIWESNLSDEAKGILAHVLYVKYGWNKIDLSIGANGKLIDREVK